MQHVFLQMYACSGLPLPNPWGCPDASWRTTLLELKKASYIVSWQRRIKFGKRASYKMCNKVPPECNNNTPVVAIDLFSLVHTKTMKMHLVSCFQNIFILSFLRLLVVAVTLCFFFTVVTQGGMLKKKRVLTIGKKRFTLFVFHKSNLKFLIC